MFPDLESAPHLYFDCILEIGNVASDEKNINFIRNVLSVGLSDRIYGISRVNAPSKNRKPGDECVAAFGFSFNPRQVFRLVDKGPSPSDSPHKASAFRRFWGEEKSELRKFSDSQILEAVVWKSNPSRCELFKDIVGYILGRHLKNSKWEVVGLELGPLPDLLSIPVSASGENMLIKGFEVLKGRLNSISCPISLNSMVPLSSSFRGTKYVESTLDSPSAFFASSSTHHQCLVPVHTCLLRVESSTRWPSEPKAIYAMICAYFVHLSRGLSEGKGQGSPIFTSICTSFPPFMDAWCCGFVFRCHLETSDILTSKNSRISLGFPGPQKILVSKTQGTRLKLSKWSENAELETNNLYSSSFLNEYSGGEFSFFVFKEALEHDSFVRNNLFGHSFQVYSDSIKLLSIWASKNFLSLELPIEIIEKIVFLANPLDEQQEDHETCYKEALCGISIEKDPCAPNIIKEIFPEYNDFLYAKLVSTPNSSLVAFSRAIYFLATKDRTIEEKIPCLSGGSVDAMKEAALASLSLIEKSFKGGESLLKAFNENAPSLDFVIIVNCSALMSSMRGSCTDICSDKNSYDYNSGLLSSFMLPGFNPTFVFVSVLKREFGECIKVRCNDWTINTPICKVHKLGIKVRGPLDRNVLISDIDAKMKAHFGEGSFVIRKA